MTQHRILIIDDDPFVRDVLVRYVRQMGYEAVDVPSGADALAMLSTSQSEEIDVILTDIMMPRMNGIELLKNVHEIVPNIPVAMITGAATLDNSIAALNAGAYAYLLKPVKSQQVEDVIVKGLQIREQNRARQEPSMELAARYHALEEQLIQLQEGSASKYDIDPLAELIRGLRHELGNAATAIKLNLSVIEQEGSKSNAMREHLQDLETSTDELISLVTRLKQYPRNKQKVMDIAELRETLSTLINSLRDRFESENLELDFELPDDDLYVRGVDVEIMRILRHILDNALEANLRAGGNRVEVSVIPEEESALIIVSDEGPGFQLEMIDTLFSPGYTTKITDGVVRGLGLGLFIARATINLYGGHIWLENKPDGGALVLIRLPRVNLEEEDV